MRFKSSRTDTLDVKNLIRRIINLFNFNDSFGETSKFWNVIDRQSITNTICRTTIDNLNITDTTSWFNSNSCSCVLTNGGSSKSYQSGVVIRFGDTRSNTIICTTACDTNGSNSIQSMINFSEDGVCGSSRV